MWMYNQPLVSGLQQKIVDALAPHVAGRKVALLDFPNYPNCGDTAIGLGQVAALRQLGAKTMYWCDHHNYSYQRICELPSDTVLLITGGGNFGDLWLHHQLFRERVLHDFPGRKIVQFPVSLEFESSDNLQRARRIIQAHGNYHLMVRDERSEALARDAFTCEVTLIPDMAFMLGHIPRSGPPTGEIVTLARSDGEGRSQSLHSVAEQQGFASVDWLCPDGPLWTREGIEMRIMRRINKLRKVLPLDVTIDRFAGVMYADLARGRMRRAIELLSPASVVLTDRLHGMILAELMGIPYLAVDTGYGKLRGVSDLWLNGSTLGRVVSDPEEACRLALEKLTTEQVDLVLE